MKAQYGHRFWVGLGLTGLSIVSHPTLVLVGIGAIATLSLPRPADAAVLTSWRFNPSNAELEITVPDGVTPRYFLLAQPARIVLDLPNTNVGSVPELQTYAGQVRQIRVGEFQPGLTRVVIELAPDVVLASPQAELRQVGQGRWVLRPLFAGDTVAGDSPVAVQPTPAPVAIAPAPLPAVEPAPLAEPPTAPDLGREPILVQPSAEPTATLPPLEPDATEIPVEVPESMPPEATAPPVENGPVATADPSPGLSPTPTPTPYDPQLPTVLPPATFSGDRPITVQVPELDSPPSDRSPITPQPPVIQASPVQPAPVQPPVSSPPVLPTSPEITATPPVTVPPVTASPVTPPVAIAPEVAVAPSSTTLLPSGTVLRLRYPRESVLQLQAGSPWQEVLVLNQAVRDRTGTIIAPEGSPVIGRFETDQEGSRFVAQAITLEGRNVRLTAQSNRLGGDRQVPEDRLVRNSAIGGLALTVLGAFTGIGAIAGALVGATAGAATTYITAPQPAIIQPNQIVEVRLTEDLPHPQ